MKALVLTDIEKLEYTSYPKPRPGKDEILVRLRASGICGSDMHAYVGHDSRRPPPLILGHEASGMAQIDGKSERVVIDPLVTCTQCWYCLNGFSNLCVARQIISMEPRAGAFAQWITIPGRNLVTVQDNLSFEQAALAEPVSTAWHGVKLAQKYSIKPLQSARILVYGGGAIGLASVLALKYLGCDNIAILETNSKRIALLTEAVDVEVHNPSADNSVHEADIVIDAVGLGITRKNAISGISPGGVVVHIGLGDSEQGFEPRKITLAQITVVGSYTYTHDEFVEVVDIMSKGGFGKLDWYKNYALSDGALAFKQLLDGQADAIKIVLNPPDSE